MKKGGLVILFSLFLNSLFAQHRVGDKLEQLYFQGHYGLIYRKARANYLKNRPVVSLEKFVLRKHSTRNSVKIAMSQV